MKITDNLIDELAQMSALSLDKEQKSQISSEMTQMLDFFDTVKNEKVDSDVSPFNKVQLDSFVRCDEVKNSVDSKLALENSKNSNNQFFVVPKVVD